MKLCRWNNAIKVLIVLVFSASHTAGAQSLLTLSDCIGQALAHNPEFRAAATTVDRAEARAGEVAADRYPSLSLSGSARRLSTTGPADEDYSGGLSMQYDLYQGGRTRARILGAELGIQAAESQRETSRQDLIFRVTEGYYRVVEQARLVDVARHQVERTEVHLSSARARLGAGVGTRLDTLRAAVEHSAAALALVRARNGLAREQGALNVLLGRDAQRPLNLAPDPNFEAVSRLTFSPNRLLSVASRLDDFEVHLSLALDRRPELQRAKVIIDQQRAEVQAIRSEYWPRIALDANYAWSGPSMGSLSRDWRAGVALNLPLFTGFSTRFRVAQARTTVDQLEAEQAALRQEVGRQVWEVYLAVQEAHERIDQTAILATQAQERMAVAEGEYRAGVGSMVEMVDAQTALTEAEEARVSAFADYWVTLARLDRVAGRAPEER